MKGSRFNGTLDASLTLLAASLTLLACDPLVNDRQGEQVGDPAVYGRAKPVGTSSRALLSDEQFREVVVEVQYVQGYAPPQEALNKFQSFLENHLKKRRIQLRQAVAIPANGLDSYGVADIRALEARYRHEESVKNRVALYFLFVDKPSRDDQPGAERLLGQAYQNTSVVIYESTLRELMAAASTRPATGLFEATLMAHETGHLLGLVGDGILPVQPEHQDLAHGHHCANPACLMHFSAESVALLGNLTAGAMPELDQACVDDLRSNGGK